MCAEEQLEAASYTPTASIIGAPSGGLQDSHRTVQIVRARATPGGRASSASFGMLVRGALNCCCRAMGVIITGIGGVLVRSAEAS